MGTSVQMLQKTYSRLTARLKAHKIKRQPYRPELVKKSEPKAMKIIETDAELRDLNLSEVCEDECELEREVIEVVTPTQGKISDGRD